MYSFILGITAIAVLENTPVIIVANAISANDLLMLSISLIALVASFIYLVSDILPSTLNTLSLMPTKNSLMFSIFSVEFLVSADTNNVANPRLPIPLKINVIFSKSFALGVCSTTLLVSINTLSSNLAKATI